MHLFLVELQIVLLLATSCRPFSRGICQSRKPSWLSSWEPQETPKGSLAHSTFVIDVFRERTGDSRWLTVPGIPFIKPQEINLVFKPFRKNEYRHAKGSLAYTFPRALRVFVERENTDTTLSAQSVLLHFVRRGHSLSAQRVAHRHDHISDTSEPLNGRLLWETCKAPSRDDKSDQGGKRGILFRLKPALGVLFL